MYAVTLRIECDEDLLPEVQELLAKLAGLVEHTPFQATIETEAVDE